MYKRQVEDIDGVKGVFSAAGQLQIILGTGVVNKVYDEFLSISGMSGVSKDEAKEAAAQKQPFYKRAIKTLGDIFVPIIPAIVASGFLMGIMEALNFMVNNGFLNLDTSGSVSYTHLDVYKRQLLSITAANEDGTYSACDAEKTDYTLTLDETFPEEQKELLVPEAVVTVTGPEGSLADTESGKSFTITAVQAQEEDTEDSLAVKRAGFEKVNGFAVDDSVIGTMYAKQSVNVRKGPSTDYEKIGGRSLADD